MLNRYVGIGLFVVLGSALFTAAVFLIGNEHNIFAKHVELYTEVKNLSGLSKGAKIRVGGFDAGEVTAISIPESPSSGFRLTLRITDQVRGLVRTDSVATIATEGVVGDKVLLIGSGSSRAPEAAPKATLRSGETSDIADLVERGTMLVGNASDTLKVVGDKLTTALDSITATVNNADDLVLGLKQGRGAIGMLLRDEQTATDIRNAIKNVQTATTSLNHASEQADELVTDFQSRGLGAKVDGMMGKADAMVADLKSRDFGAKIDQTMETVQSAARNIDVTTQQLQGTVAKALAPDARGREAGDNIRETLASVNEATTNLAEDTEALKRGFLFRGFFKRRGYYSMARLTPESYRKDRAFSSPKNARLWIEAGELFEPDGEGEAISKAGKARLDAAIGGLGERAIGAALVVEGYAILEGSGDDLRQSDNRAALVRKYLQVRFHRDGQSIGTVALRGVPPASTKKSSWNGICIVLLPQVS